MERLEQSWSLRIQSAKVEIAELGAQFIREDEAGVDDLAVLAVAKLTTVARATDRILDRSDDRRDCAGFVVVERSRLAQADDRMLCKQPTHRRDRRFVRG